MTDLIERLLNPPPLETHTIYASGGEIKVPVFGAYAVWFATMREAAAEIDLLLVENMTRAAWQEDAARRCARDDCANRSRYPREAEVERDCYRNMAIRLAITLKQIVLGDNCDEWAAIQAGRNDLQDPEIAALLKERENG